MKGSAVRIRASASHRNQQAPAQGTFLWRGRTTGAVTGGPHVDTAAGSARVHRSGGCVTSSDPRVPALGTTRRADSPSVVMYATTTATMMSGATVSPAWVVRRRAITTDASGSLRI